MEKSRVEIARERKVKADQLLKKVIAEEKSKSRKQDTRDKILLGVVLQGLIASGAISDEVFKEGVSQYLKTERDRDRCINYFNLHRLP